MQVTRNMLPIFYNYGRPGGFLADDNAGSYLLGDFASNLALHRNDAVELAIELIVPNVTLVENPNQLGGNPHVCGIAPHASPEYIVGVQITANLGDGPISSVSGGGDSRDHCEFVWICATELRLELFAESLA